MGKSNRSKLETKIKVKIIFSDPVSMNNVLIAHRKTRDLGIGSRVSFQRFLRGIWYRAGRAKTRTRLCPNGYISDRRRRCGACAAPYERLLDNATVIASVVIVPQRLAHHDAGSQDFDLLGRAGRGIRRDESFIDDGHKIFIVTHFQNRFEYVSHDNTSEKL